MTTWLKVVQSDFVQCRANAWCEIKQGKFHSGGHFFLSHDFDLWCCALTLILVSIS